MKIADFKKIIDILASSSISKDDEVMIVLSDGRFPGTPSIKVDKVGQGFDWDHGKILLYPEQPLVRKQVKPKK